MVSPCVFLIGMMGAGKTTVGSQLARHLGRRFVDLDHEIENQTGVKIPIIFEIEGEAGFRDRESHTLAEFAAQEGLIVATGGGVVLRSENREILKKAGIVVYLSADPQLLYARTRRSTNRPLLQGIDPLKKIYELHIQRDPLYREVADISVVSHGGSVMQLVKQIDKELKKCAR